MLHLATVFFFGHIIYHLEALDLKKIAYLCHQLLLVSLYFLISPQFREGRRSIYWRISVDVVGSRHLTLFAMSLFFWLLLIVAIFEVVYYRLDLMTPRDKSQKFVSSPRTLRACQSGSSELQSYVTSSSDVFFWHVIYHLEDLDKYKFIDFCHYFLVNYIKVHDNSSFFSKIYKLLIHAYK